MKSITLKKDIKTLLLTNFPQLQSLRFFVQKHLKSLMYFLRFLPGNSTIIGPPRGIYLSSEEYNSRQNSLIRKIEKIKFQDEELVERNLPITNSDFVNKKFQKFQNASIVEKTGYTIHNARYFNGYGGNVITEDDKLFFPCSPIKNEWVKERHQALYKIKLPKLIQLDKVVLIDTKCSENNYGHWMLDHVSRFYWLKKMNLNVSEYTLVSSYVGTKYQKDSYEVLFNKGFNFKNMVSNTNLHFKCNELVIPPYATDTLNGDARSYDKKEINFIREMFLSQGRGNLNLKKIYLSRRKSLRTFQDEALLVSYLEELGFVEVFMEDYTIVEQAVIFNNANVIIGFHGAGLTNLYFSNPKIKVIEIFNPDFIVTNFWGIANQIGFDYYAYCEDTQKVGIEHYRLARQAPAKIDIDNFMNFVRQVL